VVVLKGWRGRRMGVVGMMEMMWMKRGMKFRR